LANETSSLAKLAIRRFNIGEKGGSCPRAIKDRSRTVGGGVAGAPEACVLAEAVTFGLSSVEVKSLSLRV
jgi:hypothetical protein